MRKTVKSVKNNLHTWICLIFAVSAFLFLNGCGQQAEENNGRDPPIDQTFSTLTFSGQDQQATEGECDHLFVDGVCIRCGATCKHVWDNGICIECGFECQHEKHDLDSQECLVCGKLIPHQYRGGACECGKEYSFHVGKIPAEYLQPIDHAGTVVSCTYETIDQRDNSVLSDRVMDIYLPYRYSRNRQYNVLVLTHGGGDDYHSFTTNVYDAQNISFRMAYLYDNMIEKALCEPFIVVAPWSGILDPGVDQIQDMSYSQMAYDIRNVILPYIAETYSTYAASGRQEDLVAARTHFGIGGISNGALYALNSGMGQCMDLFSNFICLSGNNRPSEVATSINHPPFNSMPITCFFAGAGVKDNQKDAVLNGYRTILDSTERLKENQNAWYYEAPGGHTWETWSCCFYNALPLMFAN